MTAVQFRKLLAKGSISTGKNGRLKYTSPSPADAVADTHIPSLSNFDSTGYLFIPGTVYSSKNSKRIFARAAVTSNWKCKVRGVWKIVRPFIVDSVPVTKYKKEKAGIYKELTAEFLEMAALMPLPLYVEFVFVMPADTRWDFNNLSELVQDMMVSAGWVKDDDVRNLLPIPPPKGRPAYYVDKKSPGVFIKIL